MKSPFVRLPVDNGTSIEAWLVSDLPSKKDLLDETFARMGREAMQDYLLLIATRESKRRQRRINYLALSIYLPVVLACLVGEIWCFHSHIHAGGMFALPLNAVNVSMNLVNRKQMRPSRLYQAALNRLADVGDVRALPFALEYLLVQQRECPPFGDAVVRLLHRIDATNSGVLTKRHWNMISMLLLPIGPKTPHRELRERLAEAAMVAVRNARKAECLPRMKKLAETPGKYAEGEHLQAMARHYLPPSNWLRKRINK